MKEVREEELRQKYSKVKVLLSILFCCGARKERISRLVSVFYLSESWRNLWMPWEQETTCWRQLAILSSTSPVTP